MGSSRVILSRIRSAYLAALLLLASAAMGAAQDLSAPLPLDPSIKSGTLANGLTYFIRQNGRPEKRAMLRLAVKAGSMDELVGAIHTIASGGSYVDPRLDRILLYPRATAQVPQLSPREREIMHLMAEGRTAEAIADEISVSVETVRTHVRNVIRKLQARNRVHAIALALERGEIALDAPPRTQ